MTLLTYLTLSNKKFRYVGTIWGTIWGDQPVDPIDPIPGKDLARTLRRLGYGGEDIASYYGKEGYYYLAPWGVTYRNGSTAETVLELEIEEQRL